MDLAQLNQQSAKVAVFPVRIIQPHLETYQFKNKYGQQQDGHVFKCHLVGLNPTSYAEAVCRGKKDDLDKAVRRFTANSCWSMRKIGLDTKSKPEYVGAPLKQVILLSSSVLEHRPEDDVPKMFEPQNTVAEAALITNGGICFDLLGLVRQVSEPRTFGDRQKAVVELVDTSQIHDKTAALQVGVWQDVGTTGLIEKLTNQKGKAVVLTNVRSQFNAANAPPLDLNTSKTSLAITDVHGAAAEKIMEAKDELLNKSGDDVQFLSKFTADSVMDWEAEAAHMCLHVLGSLDVEKVSGLYQVLLATVDMPAESPLRKDGTRIFFETTVHDVSGSMSVWVTEEAAVALTGEDMDANEWLQRHSQQDLVFQPANLKLALTTGQDGRRFWVAGRAQAYDWSGMDLSAATFQAFEHLQQLHIGTGNILVSRLSDIKMMAHYGLSATYSSDAADVTRNGLKILTLVQGTARTTSEECGSGKQVVTKIRDPFTENGEMTMKTYCDASRELDYKLDRQMAVVSVTGKFDATFEIDAVTVIAANRGDHCKNLVTKWLDVRRRIGTKEGSRKDLKRRSLALTPTRLRKCRTLASTPSDPKDPARMA